MEKEYFMVYPIHIDSSKSLNGGRRYSRASSVDSPKCTEIRSALDRLKIEYLFEADRRHPQDLDRKGRYKIRSKDRSHVIKSLVETIDGQRRAKKLAENTNKVPNLLELVPRKKKNKSKR